MRIRFFFAADAYAFGYTRRGGFIPGWRSHLAAFGLHR
jgi:hypothetical protein